MRQLKFILLILLVGMSISFYGQRVGINNITPSTTFHITNLNTDEPLRAEGFVSFGVSDSTVLVVDPADGTIRYMSIKDLSNQITLDTNQVLGIVLSNTDSIFSNTNFIDSLSLFIYNKGDTLLSNQQFVDSIYTLVRDNILIDSYLTDSLYVIFSDSLLNDTAFLSELGDSVDKQDIDSITLLNTILAAFIENGDSSSVNLLALASDSSFVSTIATDSNFVATLVTDSNFISQITSDSSFIDSILANNFFTDSLYRLFMDSTLNDSAFLAELGDSIDNQNLDSADLNSTTLGIYIEDGNDVTVDLLSLASDSSFVSTIATDSNFVAALVTDSNFISQITSDSTFIDSLLGNKTFTDSIYILNRDSLMLDTNFLSAIADSIDSDVDSVKLVGDTALAIYEDGKIITADISNLKDSSEWIDGSLVGLTAGNIYARKALTNGDTVVVTSNGSIGVGTGSPTKKIHVYGSSPGLTVEDTNTTSTVNLRVLGDGTARTTYVDNNIAGRRYDVGTGPQAGGISNFGIRDNTSSTTRFLIDSFGNIGVGTIAPLSALDIANGRIVVRTPGAPPVGGAGTEMYYDPTVNSGTGFFYGFDRTGTAYKDVRIGTTGEELIHLDAATFRMGLGTISPTHKLDVKGETRIRSINDTNNIIGLLTANDSGVIMNIPYDTLLAKINDSSEWIDGSLVGLTAGNIYARKALVKGDTIVIDNKGYLGINIKSPQNRFHAVDFDNTVYSSNDVLSESYSNSIIACFENRGGGNNSGAFVRISNSPSIKAMADLGVIGSASVNGAFVIRTRKSNGFVSEKLRINTNTGNIGIGSVSPNTKLQVSDSIDGTFNGLAIDNRKVYGVGEGVNETSRLILSLTETGSQDPTTRVMGYIEAGTENENSSANGFLALGTRTTIVESEKVRITAAGYVGIGNPGPSRKLHITETAASNLVQMDDNDKTWLYGIGSANGFGFYEDNAAVTNNRLAITTGGNIGINTSTPTGRFNVNVDQDLTKDSSFVIRESGLVGIGTISPSAKLDVTSVTQNFGTFEVTTPNSAVVFYEDGDLDDFMNIRSSVGKGFVFSSAPDRTDVVIRDTLGGAVGIGTIAPSEKLDVIGNIRASGTFISGATTLNVPDYVFETYFNGSSTLKEDYSFNQLSDVYEYVKKNNHLPGIESAQSIKTKGVFDVTQAALNNLEKIEELYLHVIEINNEKEILKSKVKKLEKENKELTNKADKSLIKRLDDQQKQIDELKLLLEKSISK